MKTAHQFAAELLALPDLPLVIQVIHLMRFEPPRPCPQCGTIVKPGYTCRKCGVLPKEEAP